MRRTSRSATTRRWYVGWARSPRHLRTGSQQWLPVRVSRMRDPWSRPCGWSVRVLSRVVYAVRVAQVPDSPRSLSRRFGDPFR